MAKTGRRDGREAKTGPRPSPFRPRRSVAPQGFTAEGGGSFAAPTGHALSVKALMDGLMPKAIEDGETSSQIGGLEYRVIVICNDESQQAELLERFENEGLKCQALIS